MSQQTNVRMWVVTLILAVAVASMANLSFLAIASEPQRASAPSSEAERTLLVSGTGKVSVAPDEAQVTLGVETEAPTAKEAAASNAQSMDRVINALKATGVAESNIKTVTYAITPVYSYPKDGKPELVGYRVTNTILVKTPDLERVGDIIDAAVTSDANTVGGIAFTLS
ncbi:MAG: SIMPL domain-containing protein, partial [Candidatus Bathyarchaeia archaeon]